jgi:peptidoglycan/xylan/chitin deacetylase (PgdA/CDA1 family)
MSLLRQGSKALFSTLDHLALPLKGPRILIYHQIGGGSGLEMEVEAERFRWQLDWLVAHADVVDLETALSHRDRNAVVISFDDGYRSVFELAFPLLVERGLPFALYLTTRPIETGSPLQDGPGREPLRWRMVDEMRQSGLATIGAHTHSHPDFRHTNPETLEQELELSNGLIWENVGIRPDHFAYPWGYWSERADPLVRERYTTAALGCRLPRSPGADDHLIHRLPIQASDGRRWFPRRVKKGLLFEEWVRRRLRGYEGP